MAGCLIDDEQDQIFTLKMRGEKAQEKKCSVYEFYRSREGVQ